MTEEDARDNLLVAMATAQVLSSHDNLVAVDRAIRAFKEARKAENERPRRGYCRNCGATGSCACSNRG